MTRLRADLLLLIAAILWGLAFVAQKSGMDGLGPMGFVGCRFVLSFLIMLPFALWEHKRTPNLKSNPSTYIIITFCLSLLLGMSLQQTALQESTVTNAGFLTGTYVVIVPLIAWLIFKQKIKPFVWGACLITLLGVFLLNEASVSALNIDDWLLLLAACFFALGIVLMDYLIKKAGRPLLWVTTANFVVAVLAMLAAIIFEDFNISDVSQNIWPLLYAGILSGGIAFILMALAQQYTPPSDAAVIMSAEVLFAALSGFIIFGDSLSILSWVGCILIFISILIVGVFPAILTLVKNKALEN